MHRPAATAQMDKLRLALFNGGRPMMLHTVKVDDPRSLEPIANRLVFALDSAKIESAVTDRLRSAGLLTDSLSEAHGAGLQVLNGHRFGRSPDSTSRLSSWFLGSPSKCWRSWRHHCSMDWSCPDPC